MEQKNRLFDFLYQSLREQIETGLLPYGSALPSMSQLCEIYHVGMRTVREVLKALAKEGLIQTAERKPSRVIYRPSGNHSPEEPSVRTVLEHRDSILSVYETMTILMPPLFSFSALVCGEEKMQHCLWILAHEKKCAGISGRPIPCSCMKFSPPPAVCCSVTCISAWNFMPRFPFSGSAEVPL